MDNKIDWKRKLTSRKLWMAIIGFVTGLIVFCGGSETTANEVGSLILMGASVLAYIIGEGLSDTAAVDNTHQTYVSIEKFKDGELAEVFGEGATKDDDEEVEVG